MEPVLTDAQLWTETAVAATFVLLAAIALVRLPRSGPAGRWVAAAFGTLGLSLLGVRVDDLPAWWDTLQVLLLLAFPYLLLRFTASFRDLPRWIEVAAATGLALVAAASLVRSQDPDASWFLVAGLTYWILTSSVTVVRLWQAGRGQPGVARRRMRLMGTATGLLSMALLLIVGVPDTIAADSLGWLAALASGVAFAVGFAPPATLRHSWRRREEERLADATTALLRAVTPDEVARELLAPTAEIVGAGGAELRSADGHVVAAYTLPGQPARLPRGDPPTTRNGRLHEVMPLGEGRGQLVMWTSPYAPFFGQEEIELLRTMTAVATLALERCELLADERGRRVELERAQAEADQARQEAERANMAKNDFLSRMSHELRTPLNAILGFGQLLETSELDDEDDESLDRILKAGRHLLALIDEILDLSRIEAGQLTISLEPVHTGELLDDALGLIRHLAADRSIRLSADVDGCDVHVMTDRQRCRQVLLNLLSNAVKYNYDGGRVDVACAPVSGTAVRISVRDSGPGIDPSLHDQLFEPFERLGAEASRVEGTGLGLTLSKHLVERCGGRIGFDSVPGQGSTFWVELPTAEPPSQERPDDTHRPEVRASSGGHTLLLVEDNLASLRLVEAMLRRRTGISVLPAMQGQLALELASQQQPDVIVLDLHLPDLPGRSVLHRLKADPRTRDIPVIISSADATPSRVRQLHTEGAYDYLTKPIDLHHFLETIDRALGTPHGTPSSGAVDTP